MSILKLVLEFTIGEKIVFSSLSCERDPVAGDFIVHKRHEEQEALFPSFPLFCVATAVAFGFFLSYKSSVYAAGKDECSKLSLTDIRAQRKRKKAVHMEKMRILRASRENEPPSKQLCQKDSEDEQVSKHFFFTV